MTQSDNIHREKSTRIFWFGFLLGGLTKAPFLFGGYGADYDNFLVVQASRQIALDGRYYASRFPGNPLQEYAYSLMPGAPAWAYHAVTALLTAFAAGIFALILAQRRPHVLGWATAAFIFLPSFFVSGITALDYNWSLCFFLAAVLAAMGGRPVLAGVLLGLGTGCRLPTLLIGLPLLLMFRRERRLDAAGAALFVVSAIIVGGACFVPSYLTYGPAFLKFYDQPLMTPAKMAYKFVSELWGEIGLLVLIVVLFRLVRSKRLPPRDALFWPFAACALVNLLIFLRAPFEGEYLLPAAALLLLWIGPALSKRQAQALCAGFCVSMLIGVAHDFSPQGKLIEEIRVRDKMQRYAEKLVGTRSDRPPDAIVITSLYQPLVELQLGAPYATSIEHGGRFPDHYETFYRTVTRKQFDAFKAEGRPIYVVEDPSPGEVAAMGFDPAKEGARVIRR
jgi:hypothetical protein